MTTPQEEFKRNQKRLELSLANTQDVCDRYDNDEYHRLTWRHVIHCDECGECSEINCDVAIDNVACPECDAAAQNIDWYVEICEFDEARHPELQSYEIKN